jgi:hypothetical protein
MDKLLRVGFCSVLLFFSALINQSFGQLTFVGEELLGKPTNNSIAINIVVNQAIKIYYEYGTTSGSYTDQTGIFTTTANVPMEVVITGLNKNTRYYYRLRYSTDDGSTWTSRTEHSFWTQRSKGSSYKFTITSDSHAQFNSAHQTAMTNILADQPDFDLDLGDTFCTDGTTSQTQVNNKYLAYREPLYMDRIGHSIPIFLSSGNHENEEGWNFDDTPFSIALGSVQARKWYFPTPIPDGFYTGNSDPLSAINETIYGDEYREDYYAWEWGDALFVVIDPFQYTMNLPYTPVAGEGNDDAVTGDQWSWTLGVQQFNWFKQTIQNSNAKYKFVFSHQMVGGIPRTVPGSGPGYVRGGAEAAGYFEWGGKNGDGSDGFISHRNSADFGTKPIHQLMLENGVSAYFHGHDHQFVYEKRDGIVYQEVPSPSLSGSGFGGIYTVGNYSDYQTIAIQPNSGHLRITIDPAQATVEYVRSNQSGVTYTYTIQPSLIAVNTKIFLQGSYNGSSMNTTLNANGYLPLSQPFNISPWNYSGTESIASGFFTSHTNIVDWVLLELRTGTASGTKVATRAAFIKNNGTIVDLDGSSSVVFTGKAAGNYYIVIRHRNHLAIMSATAVALSSSSSLYDFTTGSGQYYGGQDAAVNLGSGVWGLVGGNADNSDQSVFPSDAAAIRTDFLAGAYGYLNTDVDMDGAVLPSDYALCRINFLAGRSSQVP